MRATGCLGAAGCVLSACFVLSACLVLAGGPLLAEETPNAPPQPTKQQLEFFENKIRPVLAERCYECHSAKAAANQNLKGGLALDSREATRRGGESGPAVVPGRVDESLLIAALRHETVEMPPEGKLPDNVIADFVEWVKMGAPDPREGPALDVRNTIDIEAGRSHWAFQPLREEVPPSVEDTGWVRTPIDQFIRARQQAAGVQPNTVADPRTLIRRATYDLLGLPPTAERVERFVDEFARNPQAAYDQLIDELLASAHYGERWGRHWLDIVRFAESNGYAFDRDRPHAWHYRDFVIRALNDDMPYDQFVRRQIAGDLLADLDVQTGDDARQTIQLLAATGFVVAGPFTTQQTQKERERSRYEQLDDVINTLGTSLLGLTVGCCRCHDHKYDPLPIKDYYRLASCFAEVGFADTGINTRPEAYRQAKAAYDQAHAPLVEARGRHEREVQPKNFEQWLARRSEATSPSEPAAERESEEPTLAEAKLDKQSENQSENQAGEQAQNQEEKPEASPLPEGVALGAWYHVGPFPAANMNEAFDRVFAPERAVDLQATYEDGKLAWNERSEWADGQPHNDKLQGNNCANYLFRVIESDAPRVLHLSLGSDDSLKLWVNGREALAKKVGRNNAEADQEKVAVQLAAGRNELLLKIVNGGGSTGFYFQASPGQAPEEIGKLLAESPDQWKPPQRQKVLDWYRGFDLEWLALDQAVRLHALEEPQPELTPVYAAKVRGTTYQFGADTYKVYHLRRGNADNKEEEADPGFLQVLMRSERREQQWLDSEAEASAADSPRLALADWLTDVDRGAGPLLARVIVNRLWHHHFGRGIVATPSDFGTRGEPPSHPELLDWLASELIRGGWRLKPIHKLIMTSGVYMQDVRVTESGRRHDPENLLLWRRNVRRLEAEVIRDALLSVGGRLDTTMYGQGTLDQNSPRRSVYLTVKRSNLIPLLQLFDAPDAMQGVGAREESTVAPQALAMLNSPFVRDMGTRLAARLDPSNTRPLEELVQAAYETALSRPATAEETANMTAFIQRQEAARPSAGNARQLAVRDFCHLLLCTNEFVYVD